MAFHRRKFLGIVTGAGGAIGLGLTAWWLRSDATQRMAGQSSLQEVTRESAALGSKVSMTALHADRAVAERAIAAAFDELELVEDLMSIYRPQSQLSRLNRDGKLDEPHPYVVEILNTATLMSQQSGGAFDITVQSLWSLFDNARRGDKLPSESEVADARRRVDWRRVEVVEDHVRLHGAGTQVTLNGIAQGFAADRAAAVLRAHGVVHALIDTGEIGSLGSKSSGEDWKVGIQHPRHDDAYLRLAKLNGRCLATSGDYEMKFTDDYRCHHLFDPHTGQSPADLASVSVAAGSALQADALSTAVFVLGPEAGSRLIAETPGADALFVLKNGRTLATAGFPSSIS